MLDVTVMVLITIELTILVISVGFFQMQLEPIYDCSVVVGKRTANNVVLARTTNATALLAKRKVKWTRHNKESFNHGIFKGFSLRGQDREGAPISDEFTQKFIRVPHNSSFGK